jgi:hypothetical protein
MADKPDFIARIGAQTITARSTRQEFRTALPESPAYTAVMSSVTLTAVIGPQEFRISAETSEWQKLLPER